MSPSTKVRCRSIGSRYDISSGGKFPFIVGGIFPNWSFCWPDRDEASFVGIKSGEGGRGRFRR